MQPAETYSIPRRVLDVEDYIDILRRHKGWICGPFLFCLAASVVGAYLWPDTYVSTGVIKIEPQQISTNLVQASVTQDMMDQINSMQQSIESRGVLTNIINTYDLYPREKAREPMEDVIEYMKDQIKVVPLGASESRNVPAFKISFAYPDRIKAQKVVTDIIGRFTSENTRNQDTRAFAATELLKGEAEQAKREYDAVENALSDYMTQFNGRLPEQRSENLQRLSTLTATESTLNSRISQLQQDKLNLETTLQFNKRQTEQMANFKQAEGPAKQLPKSPKLQAAEADVDHLRLQLQVLLQKYTDNNPQVKSVKDYLAVAEKERDKIAAEDAAAAEAEKKDVIPGKPGITASSLRENLTTEAQEEGIRIRISTEENEIEALTKQLKSAEADIKILEGQIISVPQSAKQYDELRHELELKRDHYQDMTRKLTMAQLNQDVENKKEGQTLDILDNADLPINPEYPKHPLVIGIGAAVGLLLGIVVAGAREMKDTSLKNLKDVRAYTQMQILGSVPLLENDFVVRRRKRMAWLAWTTACLTAAVLMSGSIIYYYTAKNQLP